MSRESLQSEARLQREIIAALGALDGCVCWRNNCGTALHGTARVEYGVGGPGAPDLLCEVTHQSSGLSVALWIEIKVPTGVVAANQRQWHDAARRTGRNVAVVRSVEQALQVVRVVREYGYLGAGWTDAETNDAMPPMESR